MTNPAASNPAASNPAASNPAASNPASTAPTSSPAARFAGSTGIGFAVTFLAGFFLVAQVPAYDAADSAWIDYVENDNVRTVIGTLLLTAAGILLMAFLTSLASHLRMASDGRDDHRTAVLRGAGTMAGVTLAIAALVGGAMSAAVTFASDFEAPGAELIRSLDQLGLGLMLVGTGWTMAVAIAISSAMGRRSSRLPGWLTMFGFAGAVLLIFSPLFLPIVVLPLWAVVTGVVVVRADT